MTEFHLSLYISDADSPSFISHVIKDGNKRLLVCYDLTALLTSTWSLMDTMRS